MNGKLTNDHAWDGFAAAYALDAMDAGEREEFETHLAGCERCQAELAEMREVAAALAHAAPAAAPPPALRERVLAEARQVRPITAARRPERAPRLAWLATAASVALALLAGWQYRQARQESATLAREYASAREALAQRDSLLGALLAPQVQTIQLTAGEHAPSVRLFWNRERNLVVMTAANLPPAGPGRTYQLWGIAAGHDPVSLGTFDASPSGEARLAVAVPAELQLAVSAITEEPEGGSPQPTTTPFLVGEWGA